MKAEEFLVLYQEEETYWWHVGLRALIFTLMGRYRDKIGHAGEKIRILDAGCGTGIFMKQLEKYGEIFGLDISEDALRFSGKRGIANLCLGSAAEMPFNNGVFRLITANDVLCHERVKNDAAVLREFYRVLEPGGLLLLNLPAYDFLKSGHDAAVKTRHRYTKKEVQLKIRDEGFSILKATYWNTFLTLPMMGFRLFNKFNVFSKTCSSDIHPLPAVLNNILICILRFEALLLKKMNFPFGLSVFCMAQKSRRLKHDI